MILSFTIKGLAIMYYGFRAYKATINLPKIINRKSWIILMIGGLLLIAPQLTALAALFIAFSMDPLRNSVDSIVPGWID